MLWFLIFGMLVSALGSRPVHNHIVFFQVKHYAGVKIDQKRLDDLILLASDLASIGDSKRTDNLYERTKCPGEFTAPKIPATAFTQNNAELAVQIAEKICTIANSVIS